MFSRITAAAAASSKDFKEDGAPGFESATDCKDLVVADEKDSQSTQIKLTQAKVKIIKKTKGFQKKSQFNAETGR